MNEIKWGKDILITAGRPTWLKDGEQILNSYFPPKYAWTVNSVESWIGVGAIKLPADHPYYTATAAGFVYWPGGEDAPDDWDGGDVLRRCGVSYSARLSPEDWQRGYHGDIKLHAEYDIIGYHRHVEPVERIPSTITVPIETEVAIRRELEDTLAKVGNIRDAVVAMFAIRAVLRDETIAERFRRETGYELTPAVLAALDWERQ